MSESVDLFLRTIQSPNTARAYSVAIRDFERSVGTIEGEIVRERVATWVARMAEKGLADTTINQRLAAVSSYFVFAEELGTIRQAPRLKALRRKVNPYGKSGYLRAEQIRSLLASIDRKTVQGCRDYALILMFLATGRRSSEIRLLKWGDFQVDSGKCWYHWSGKGKKSGTRECPWDVWEAILEWLERSGRLIHIHDEDFVFVAISFSATRLPRVTDGWKPGKHPLAMQTVGQLLERYACKAGIGHVHVHMLRHSAAMLRKQVGEDVGEIQEFLGHSSAAVTQVYLHQLEDKSDVSWIRVRDILGIRSER